MIRQVRPPLVIVEWLDAASSIEDVEASSMHTIDKNMTYSAGWLIKRDQKGAYLTSDWLESGEMRILHFIPNGMIRVVRTVRAAAPRTRTKK